MKWLLVSDNNSYASSLSRLLQEKFPASEIFVKSERDSLGFGFDFLCGITHAAFFCPLNKNASFLYAVGFLLGQNSKIYTTDTDISPEMLESALIQSFSGAEELISFVSDSSESILQEQLEEHYIPVTTGDGMFKVDISQIYYIETEKHAVRLYYTKGSFHINDTLKSIEEKLKNAPFCRCNNCYLVNLAHVEQVKKDFVIVAGHELAFSRLRYKPFMEALTNYMGGARR